MTVQEYIQKQFPDAIAVEVPFPIEGNEYHTEDSWGDFKIKSFPSVDGQRVVLFHEIKQYRLDFLHDEGKVSVKKIVTMPPDENSIESYVQYKEVAEYEFGISKYSVYIRYVSGLNLFSSSIMKALSELKSMQNNFLWVKL